MIRSGLVKRLTAETSDGQRIDIVAHDVEPNETEARDARTVAGERIAKMRGGKVA